MNSQMLRDFDLRIIALDAAIENTGYAIYYVSSQNNFQLKLMSVGILNAEKEGSTDTRIRGLLQQIKQVAYNYSVNCYIIEEPPSTIYGWAKMSKPAIIGRAASIFKVIGVVYSLVGECNASNTFCRLVFPSQWRGDIKGDKKGKSKSLAQANRVIETLKFKYPKLKESDDHIADAINVGLYAITQWHSGNWVMPNLARESAHA